MNLLNIGLLVSLLTSVLIPAASSLISKQHWPSEITAGITVVLSAVSAFVAEAVSHADFHLNIALLLALGNYVIAALARSQFWRGTATDARLLAVGSKPRA